MSGVWVTGPSRSGTSLTAGLLAAHGVFFGDCGKGDKFNPKGYWEHPELVRRVEKRTHDGWPDAFWNALKAEGWDWESPWGIKRGPNAWPWVAKLGPSVIIKTYRPRDQIQASRKRWGREKNTSRALAKADLLLWRIEEEAPCPIVHVHTDQLVRGKFGSILQVFSMLGLAFDPAIADEWIDPSIWNRGLGK